MAGLPPDVPVTVLGVSSNILVRDGGVKGVVVRLMRGFTGISVEGNEVVAGAGALDLNVALSARDHALAGLEFLSGIPGHDRWCAAHECRRLRGRPGAGPSCGRGGRSCGQGPHGADRRHGLPLSPQRRAVGLDFHLGTFAWDARRPACHRPPHCRDRHGPHGFPAAQPHRRFDLRQSAGPARLGADRRGRVPRSAHRRGAGVPRSIATS